MSTKQDQEKDARYVVQVDAKGSPGAHINVAVGGSHATSRIAPAFAPAAVASRPTDGAPLTTAETQAVASNAWQSGGLLLFAGVVIIGGLWLLWRHTEVWMFVPLFGAGLLAWGVFGALLLRYDGRLSDASFVELMKEAYRQIPVLGKAVPPLQPAPALPTGPDGPTLQSQPPPPT
jgi:hypothetical protein